MTTRTSTIQPRRILVALALLFGLAAMLLHGAAPKAFADTPDPAPVAGSTSTSGGDDTEVISVPVKVVASAVASSTATASSYASASAYATAAAQVRSTVKVKKSNCFWTTGINTYYSGGKLKRYYDPVKAKVCKLKKSKKIGGHKYKYKKVAGGTSGTNCGNYFQPKKIKVSYKRASVLDVKSGTYARVKVWSTAAVKVSARVNVTLEYTVNGKVTRITKAATGYGSGRATKYATATSKVTKKTSTKTVSGNISRVKVSTRSSAYTSARASAVAVARAQAVASISTVIKIEVPKPKNQPPSGDFKLPQHLYVGGTYCAKFYGSDPEDKANVQMTTNISGPASFVDETDNCAKRDDTENSQRVITQPIKAGSTPGTVTVTLVVKDSAGQEAKKTFSFPVLADDFPATEGK